MNTVLIIHGIGGHAGIHWQQWLSDELTGKGHKVLMPEMPNADQPDRQVWLETIKETLLSVDLKDLIIVGHSLGVTTALDFIEQADSPMEGFVSVSGFAEDYGAELNRDFLKKKHIAFSKVNNNLSWSCVVYGDDDPYVTQEALKYVADKLGVEPLVVPRGGHLNTDTGFTTFPRLLKIVTKGNQ